MLWIMYFNGQGTTQDRYIAAIYFYKGARRGNANAQLCAELWWVVHPQQCISTGTDPVDRRAE